jgi:hypothetical protein
MSPVVRFLILSFLFLSMSVAQSPNGTISGIVHDPSDRPIPGAEIIVVNDLTNIQYLTKTNDEGIYVVLNLPPGPYRIQVSKRGFKTLIKPGLTLNVQDALSVSITLPLGAVNEVVTVEGGAPMINTTDATVSTVVDRQFAENLPMNGRSFQTLIQLTPGVVLTVSNPSDSGQFSVNGQRADSNYWMVDGVSANIGIGVNPFGNPGNGLGGALGSFSAVGGTNSLVSVDALQEFRIQTSTYAPEFGRTPGGQISIVTRSGTNALHGTLFDYFRNDALDASNWFNGYTNSPPLAKARERQNDFGGTFSGPILKDRTFFFFSYEGLRLRLPETILTTVPDLNAREMAMPAVQPFLNAYPKPNGTEVLDMQGNPTGIAHFNSSYSNPAGLDAYSLRIDHKLNHNITLFGRYNYSPSSLRQRGAGTFPLSTVDSIEITTKTATLGGIWFFSPTVTNDLRFNYSRTNADGHFSLDNFGGAVPISTLPFPTPFTSRDAFLSFDILGLQQGSLNVGKNQRNVQRQINVVDSLSMQKGPHSVKLGVDFRRLSPLDVPAAYIQDAFFGNVQAAETGNLLASELASNLTPTFLFRNLGTYAQDTWRIAARLTLTYGFRWDIDFVPQSIHGPGFPAVTGFNLADLSELALAAPGTPPYQTTYGNVAPRLGIAYQIRQNQKWQTVLRGGFGVFYDLASSQAGNLVNTGFYPFGGVAINFGGSFPLDASSATPPPIVPPAAGSGRLYAFDPHLRLPYALEWNVALEQALGKDQTVSASYVGSTGRRLIQSAFASSPSQNFGSASLVSNTAASDYNALQLQLQRRLSSGLQALASYTWSHSIDSASAGSSYFASNAFLPSATANSNRGPSDFDIRNAFSAGLTFDIPSARTHSLANAFVRDWSVESTVQARSAPPVDISDSNFFEFANGFQADIRPDVVPGQPLYVRGSACASAFGPGGCPGGKGFNPNAFRNPPTDPQTGLPLRQGDVPRNLLRGFGAVQWDFAVHRGFPIHDSLRLEFRAEMFNVLNHPNFGQPSGSFGFGGFGLSNQMLGQYLNGGGFTSAVGAGAFSPLYQIGGPRSIQLAVKVLF